MLRIFKHSLERNIFIRRAMRTFTSAMMIMCYPRVERYIVTYWNDPDHHSSIQGAMASPLSEKTNAWGE